MFERFTKPAREVVVLAQHEARELRHGYVDTEHLLLGLLGVDAGVGGRSLRSLEITHYDVLSDIRQVIDGDFGEGDAEALRAIGIDLDEVRRRVEESFGEGALDGPVRGRRRCGPVAGHIPFTPRAKKVLQLSLREALALEQRHIGTEHLLLGIVREERGLAAHILAERGATPERVRATVLSELGRERPGRSA